MNRHPSTDNVQYLKIKSNTNKKVKIKENQTRLPVNIFFNLTFPSNLNHISFVVVNIG